VYANVNGDDSDVPGLSSERDVRNGGSGHNASGNARLNVPNGNGNGNAHWHAPNVHARNVRAH